jgi:hypothetical protein
MDARRTSGVENQVGRGKFAEESYTAKMDEWFVWEGGGRRARDAADKPISLFLYCAKIHCLSVC